jgi:Bifunctional DNA primase/polymerase, N-terminal/Protein of unknown function (DUF3987)
MGAFGDMGVRLIERGYAVVPIIPGTKRPGVLSNGQWIGLPRWQTRYNGRAPTATELEHWGEGDTGIGVLGGYGGLAPIDIDTDNIAIRAALDVVLPGTTVRKIGKRGETLFYYAPHVKVSKRWLIGGSVICELIGPGRQTVLPPTMHPDTGAPYYWSGADTLENVAPHELPPLPTDILVHIEAVLATFGYTGERPPQPSLTDEDTPHRQLNAAAMANLVAWVPALPLYRLRAARGGYEAVPIWRPSSTGRSDDARDPNLKIHPRGIRDFGTDVGYTPLDLVMRALGCDLDRAFGFLAERLGWSIGATVEVRTAQPEAEPAPDPDPLLQYATNVPGVVGNIIEYVTATARRPNAVLALATAVTVVGTLIGRRVAGPTRSATHLYTVGIAPTGNGKQHVLDSAVRLLKAAGASDHIGPSKFFSQSAMIDLLDYKPLALCPQDEIGVFLKAITSRRASSHEAATSQILRSLWGVSFATLPTPAWAARRMGLISCPAISILGVSTPDEFYGALQGDSINNGFLNRFLALQTNVRATDATPVEARVPDRLREALRALYLWSGPASLLQISDPKVEYLPDVLSWATDAARDVFEDLVRAVDRQTDEQQGAAPYIARCAEIAVRLATIRAAGRWGHGAAVDASDMEWAAGLAWAAGQALADAVEDQLPQTERGEVAEKLLATIRKLCRKRGKHGAVKVRDIQQFNRSRFKSQEIKDIIRQLIEAGDIECTLDGQYRAVH